MTLINKTQPIPLIVNRFNYQPMSRSNEDGMRKYSAPDGSRLPSVTAILERTKSEESKKALQDWRNRIGHDKAQVITTEAANTGTTMHKMLEQYVKGEAKTPGTNNVQQIAHPMAQKIIQSGLVHLDEVWGTEIPVYFPGLYAGSCDGAGLWKNKETIYDFKQTNKPKKREYVEDYLTQLVAYGLAHNALHGTNIQTGVVMMCSRDCQYQEFVLENDEWTKYENIWWDRVTQYYESQ